MSTPDEFAQFGLSTDDEYPHPCGNIPIKFLGVRNGTVKAVWGMRGGSHYPPESHAHSHTLKIECGEGTISIDGEDLPYRPGDTFDVAGDVPHGFVSVRTNTVVTQSQPR